MNCGFGRTYLNAAPVRDQAESEARKERLLIIERVRGDYKLTPDQKIVVENALRAQDTIGEERPT